MKNIKKFEDFVPVEYKNPKIPEDLKPTYKAYVKRKKKKINTILTFSNAVKDMISFKNK